MNKEDLKREIGDLIWKMATDLVHGGKVSPVIINKWCVNMCQLYFHTLA
ncbi:MAG: hypothetical protein J5965_00640 [Aeriscardovia sp.]|nr:hypothetical protein [Aeriscardovia sp.]